MRVIAQLAVFLLITLLAFAADSYAQNFARAIIFGNQYPRSYLDMICCALAGALVASVVASVPLTIAFRKRAWIAAATASFPIVALRTNEFVTYQGPLASQVKVMALVEASSYLVILVLGALLVSAVWTRPNNSFKPNPHRGGA